MPHGVVMKKKNDVFVKIDVSGNSPLMTMSGENEHGWL